MRIIFLKNAYQEHKTICYGQRRGKRCKLQNRFVRQQKQINKCKLLLTGAHSLPIIVTVSK